MLDCFDGALPAWSISPAPDEGPSDPMPEKACAGLAPDGHPVIHSDRGCHYRWPGWVAICERNGLIRSMSAKGCSPDNSAMGGFLGRPENESFYGRDWSGVGLSEFIEMLDAYLRYYNEARPKEQLGWMSPMQYRRSLGLAA